MIETESLAFETQSVQALIMQCLWEAGPSNPSAVHWNESHRDFTDPIFAAAMVQLVEKFILKQRSNWKHPLRLNMAALICVRIFEMNEDESVADRIVQLLVILRDVAFEWINKVQTAMHETDATEHSDLEKLRANLVEIAVAGALTFFVHCRHQYFDKIFAGSVTNGITATRFWLEFLVTINDNVLLSQKSNSSLQLNQKMFLRLVLRIAVQLESKIKETVNNDPNDLFEFVKSQWRRSADGSFGLRSHESFPDALIISVTIATNVNYVQIGLLSGEFLVNNLPVSRLPKTITEHPQFQRVFEEFIFEVQEANGRFDTKFKHKNSHYSFQADGGTDDILITERRDNGDVYELIPEEKFANEIPHLLQNHSHWFCRAKNLIEFRPILFTDAEFSTPAGVQYELDLSGPGMLLHRKSKKFMLDVASDSHNEIVKQLARLESSKYIHIFMDEPQVAKVELVRMNIKFRIDAADREQESYDVISNEFNGMRVALEQNCGTLYGLRQGLLLESIPNGTMEQKQVLIVPHGKVASSVIGDHIAVEIKLEEPLRTPTFFTYQIDDTSQQLKANNRSHSAWFYLAHLHALTSHGLPDRLTEMTGTERSFQILQSAFAWSPAPYDDEALATLKMLEKLAPKRRIKNGLESIQWPDSVGTHVAHDGFLIITAKLIADSMRLDGLYTKASQESKSQEPKDSPKNNANGTTDEFDLSANRREYFKQLAYFPNLRISKAFIEYKPVITAHYTNNEKDESLQPVRTISHLYHRQTYRAPKSFSISDYLTSSSDVLKGPQTVDDDVDILQKFKKTLRNRWLTLYDVARSGDFSREKFALTLTLLAHENTGAGDLNALLVLQTVAENRSIFDTIDPPCVQFYDMGDKDDRHFDSREIEKILDQHKIKREFSREHEEYRHVIQLHDHVRVMATRICNMWPADEVNPSIYQYTHPYLNLRDAVAEINKRFRRWRNIKRLMVFLKEVDLQIRRLYDDRPVDVLKPWYPEKLPFKRMEKFYVDFDAKINENLAMFETEVSEAERMLNQPANADAKDFWDVYKSIASPNAAQYLIDASMCPRLVLSLVLPKLLSRKQNPKLKSIILAVSVPKLPCRLPKK